MNETSHTPESQPDSPEIAWGKELSATIATLVGNTLMRSNLPLEASYSKVVFKTYSESGSTQLAVETISGLGDRVDYIKRVKVGEDNPTYHEGNIGGLVYYDGKTHIMAHGIQLPTLGVFASEVEKFEGSAAEITFEVPAA